MLAYKLLKVYEKLKEIKRRVVVIIPKIPMITAGSLEVIFGRKGST
jgi:hypothetical protein